MTASVPATIASEINLKLSQVVSTMTSYKQFAPFTELELRHQIKKLQKANRFEADLLMATLEQVNGDIEAVEYALANAGSLSSQNVIIPMNRAIIYSNFLYADKSLATFNVINDHVDCYLNDTLLSSAIATGLFQMIAKLSDRFKQKDNIEMQLRNALKAANVLKALSVNDEQCAQIVGAAGEVIRSKNLFWLSESPDLYVSPNNDFVKIDYRVDATAKEAAEMSFTLMDKLIERHLHLLPFSVDFLGVAK